MTAGFRWAHLPEDTSVGEELGLARRAATEALEALPLLAQELDVGPEVVNDIRAEYQEPLADMGPTEEDDDDESPDSTAQRRRQYLELRLALLTRKRQTVVRVRDERVIDDAVLRAIQARLDVEAPGLSPVACGG
ncbi:MAG: hypothetical protein WCG47_33295 [Dermatophilaceae bacterium]